MSTPLSRAGRMLDGDSGNADPSQSTGAQVLSAIESAASSAESSVASFFRGDGATAADVASGHVDPASLSREDKAALHVDGSVPGFFQANPWHVSLDLNASVAAFTHLHGGCVIVIRCDAQTLDALESKVLATRFAFLWDDEIVAESGVLNLEVTDKTFLVVTLADQPGAERLTLFTTDASIICTLVEQAPPDQAAAIRARVFGAVGESSANPLSQFLATVQTYVDVSTLGLVVLAAVVGLTIYAVARTPAGAAAAGSLAGGL